MLFCDWAPDFAGVLCQKHYGPAVTGEPARVVDSDEINYARKAIAGGFSRFDLPFLDARIVMWAEA